MILLLILFGPSLLGFLLVVLSCFLTRRPRWLMAAFIAGLLLHLLSAGIQNQPLWGEPHREDFERAHDFAVFYFFDGLPFFVGPLLLKFLYVYFRPSKPAAKPPYE